MEEMVRTKYLDEQGHADVVNRFGLETENSGKVLLNLNFCFQNNLDRKSERKKAALFREAVQLETKKQVMHYKLLLKDELEADQRKKMQQQQRGLIPEEQQRLNIAQEEEFKLDYDRQPEQYNQFDQ